MASQLLERVSAGPMLRPPRLNYAQVCLYCEVRWCESPSCVAMHEASVWRVCTLCDGFGWITQAEHCSCLNGLEEATVATTDDAVHRVLPDRPAWHSDGDEIADGPCPVASFTVVGGPEWPGSLGW